MNRTGATQACPESVRNILDTDTSVVAGRSEEGNEQGIMILPIQPTRWTRNRSPHARLFGSNELTRRTKCAVIVAHPGDDVFGAGCLISKLIDVSILHITDGVTVDDSCNPIPSEERREHSKALRRECLSALELADVRSDQILDYFIPDRCAVHYLVGVTRRITSFLQSSGADIVITHPYEGGHPDHDATAFATHASLRLMRENGLRPPVVFEMGLYPSKDLQTRLSGFLPGSEGEITTLRLDERSRKLKKNMFACLKAQSEHTDGTVDSEKFRRPPHYNFNLPPQSNKLHYEDFDWAITSDEWQALAARALNQLFPERVSNHDVLPSNGRSILSVANAR